MTSTTAPLRAGIYARLSRFKATAEMTAAGMERQDEDCRELCKERGWQVVEVYDEGAGVSRQAKHRPEFDRALTDLKAGRIDVLVIWKLDRFIGSLWDMLRVERLLNDCDGRLVSVKDGWLDTSDPNARFILRQRAMMAEMEIENARIRVAAWHKQRAGKGLPLVSGRRPFGYVDKQRSALDREEADVVREAARRLLGQGANHRHPKSLHTVVSWLNDDLGLTAPHGKPWHVQNFRQVLLSPGIAGLRTYRAGRVTAATLEKVLADAKQGTWAPVLSRAVWVQLVKLLTDPERTRAGRPQVVHLLTGLVACGKCKAPMHSHYRADGARQYGCRKRTGTTACGKLTVKAEPVEQLIAEMVLEHLGGPGLEQARKALAAHDADDSALERELDAAKARRDEVEDMYRVGDLNRPAFMRLHAPAEAHVARVAGLLATHRRGQVLAALPDTEEELAAWWTDPATSDEERREVLRSLVSKVVIGPCGPRQNRFDPARLAPPYGPQWVA